MLIDERAFPMDTNNALGTLRSNLVKALHTARISDSTASLLEKTLSAATKLVKKVKAEKKKLGDKHG